MKKIYVVGLGPGDKKYLSDEVERLIESSKHIFLRTKLNPIVKYLDGQGIEYNSYDSYYEKYSSFEEVYEKITDNLIDNAKRLNEIVYAVPGNPIIAEKTVELLEDKVKNKKIDIEYLYGISFIDIVMTRLKIFSSDNLEILNALSFDTNDVNLKSDIIITQVYNKYVASEVKLKLMEYYEEDHKIKIIKSAGIENEEAIIEIALFEMDRVDLYDHLTTVYIPKVKHIDKYFFNDLVDTMKYLRSEDGCSWDRKQTHESLLPYLIEESYEVVEAVEEKDIDLLEEELGDLMLQVIFHCQISQEEGYFNINHVIDRLVKKLISRHPHVFKDKKNINSDEVKRNWEEIKRQEKDEKSVTDSLKRIPNSLPSLIQAYKIQNKAAKVGFDWDDINGPIEKLHEEVDEFIEAFEKNDHKSMENELGDILFTVVNISRFLNIRPELSLRKTINKFIDRFQKVEDSKMAKNKGLSNLTLNELDNLWENSKK